MSINAKGMYYKELNELVRQEKENDITLENVNGQRYIGAGSNGKIIRIEGVPGNALGAYLNGSKLICSTNAQDETGDTMNDGEIIINGNCGDACGYAMRGGKIFVKGNAGYRAGIHIKAYKEKQPSIVIGNKAGAFLGEYQAGGKIIVLGLDSDEFPVDKFMATGMHGGKIYIRSDIAPVPETKQIIAAKADENDLAEIKKELEEFSKYFDVPMSKIMEKIFYVLTPDTKNPYKQLYTNN